VVSASVAQYKTTQMVASNHFRSRIFIFQNVVTAAALTHIIIITFTNLRYHIVIINRYGDKTRYVILLFPLISRSNIINRSSEFYKLFCSDPRRRILLLYFKYRYLYYIIHTFTTRELRVGMIIYL